MAFKPATTVVEATPKRKAPTRPLRVSCADKIRLLERDVNRQSAAAALLPAFVSPARRPNELVLGAPLSSLQPCSAFLLPCVFVGAARFM